MPLWIFFIIVSFLLGLSISFLLSYRFHCIERVLFSFVVGNAITIWVTFLLACLKGSLNIDIILISIAIYIFLSVILFRWSKILVKAVFSDLQNKSAIIWHDDKLTLAFFMLILLYLTIMNIYGVFRIDEVGNLYAFHTVWADYPFHTSVITAFVYRADLSFPLNYPQFLHIEMHYPFLMDFYSAVLMKGGLDLRCSLIIPNILFQLSFFGLFFFLAYRLTGMKKVGLLATFIFIFAGLPAGLQSVNIHFLNPMYAVLMPQRTAMIGMGISFAVYILLLQALFTDERDTQRHAYRELILAGVLIGLLPYIHAHSFMVTAFVALFLSAVVCIKKASQKMFRRRDLWVLISLLVPLILLSLPQIMSIRTGVSEDFFVFFPGWTEENRNMIMGFDWSSLAASCYSIAKTITVLQMFWALNAGGLIILLSLGILKADNKARLFYLPFLLLFVIANFMKFQPWYFDNYKIFIYWLALTAVMASLAILWVTDFNRRFFKTLATVLLAILILASTSFGLVTHVAMVEDSHVIWTQEETDIADWVRENTPPDSVFLTGSAHNHPIPSLSGRPRVMGYEGWLWSHGINWMMINARKRDEKAMFGGDYALVKDYGVDYVCIGPYERAFARDNQFDINYSAFVDETRYDLAYDGGGGRWRIYEVT
ncbi:MAG: hypothetical protein U9O90_11160 [Euryarchaeota archaeon]|nr:hypothetical protein [Euryarchaeota archaeon]